MTPDQSDPRPPVSTVVRAAERLVERIDALVTEVSRLRAENTALRQEMRDAVALLDRAGTAATAGGRSQRRATPAAGAAKRRRGRPVKGRSTPAHVTHDVVRAVIVKLGEATAGEIAAEITSAGTTVNGRAIRFLAEAAGANYTVGGDGQRRYRLGA
ncbi:MAG: hypothetical protein ACR2GX_05570 [Candidatus Dormibacteria bacterium]